MARAANRQMVRASSTSSAANSRPSRWSKSSTRAMTRSPTRSGISSCVGWPARCSSSRSTSLRRGSPYDVVTTGRLLRIARALVAKWSRGYSRPGESLASNDAVVVARLRADDAGVEVDLVDVAGVHVEGAEKTGGDRLEHLTHVDALGEVEARVAYQLEVAAPRVQLVHEAHVVHRDADVAGEALGERHLLAAVLARLLRPVVDHDADLALQRAHGQDEHALEARVRGERRQGRGVR